MAIVTGNIGQSVFLLIIVFNLLLKTHEGSAQHTSSLKELLNKHAHSELEWYGSWINNDSAFQWLNEPEKYTLIDNIKAYGFIDGVYAKITNNLNNKKNKNKENKYLYKFLDYIDSLNIVNYTCDTIYIFQYMNQYLFINNDYYIAKGLNSVLEKFGETIDSVVLKNNDGSDFRVSWLPKYMQDALMSDDINTLTDICTMYELNIKPLRNQQHSIGTMLFPKINFYRIIIADGKTIDRIKYNFEYNDRYHELDQIYDEERRLISNGQYLPLRDINRFDNSLPYSVDVLFHFINKNPKLQTRINFILSMINDSLHVVNSEKDTLYCNIYYVPNMRLLNRAFVSGNMTNTYFIETVDNIVWDTISNDSIIRKREEWSSYNMYYNQIKENYATYLAPESYMNTYMNSFIVSPITRSNDLSHINEVNNIELLGKFKGVNILLMIIFEEGQIKRINSIVEYGLKLPRMVI